MKITLLLMTLGLLQVSAATFGQRITLSEQNTPLKEVLKKIKSQSGVNFLYADDILEQSKKVNIKLNNSPLDEALDKIFDQQPLSYELKENTVVLKLKTPSFLEKLAAAWRNADVHCRVEDEKGEPLPGASVRIKGTSRAVVTDDKGEFTIKQLEENTVLVISYLGYKTKEILAKEVSGSSAIQLEPAAGELKEVGIISTGYQNLNKERATGSFVQVDNQLLNRSVSTDVLSRLDRVTSGVIFNKSANKTPGDPAISVRGRSTIRANTDPLIVLDNFPYEGDLNNINPSDIESVTILKDAAAASIWGVRAGNGVIVLTSKKGKYNQLPKISMNSNVSITGKPDLFSVPQMSSAEYIEYQKYLFDHGNYDGALKYTPYLAQSPVVDILDAERKGALSHSDAAAKLSALSKIDARNDYSKYFLRNEVNQQYALNITGGSAYHMYYFSAGYDKNLATSVSSDYNRLTVNARNTFNLLKDRMELSTDISFTRSIARSNTGGYAITYPYVQLADQNGKALPVSTFYSQVAKDKYLNSGLLDWNYYPLNERLVQNSKTQMSNYRLNLGLNYKIIPKTLNLEFLYQYQRGMDDFESIKDLDSYSTRNLINTYSQIDPITGVITRPVPLGAVANFSSSNSKNNTGRLQLNFQKILKNDHEIDALIGTELKDYTEFSRLIRLYGYQTSTATDVMVDYFRDFPFLLEKRSGKIEKYGSQGGSTDRFVSYYANIGYRYKNKYGFSASARKDESNLFGVDANLKGVPLYSLGVSWNAHKESFYPFQFLPYLRLRLTNGYNGNLSKNLSAYVTASAEPSDGIYNLPFQYIVNPPNPNLSWEKVRVNNAALDFGLKDNMITGTIEYYTKKGTNLIGNSPIAPQSGVVKFTGNSASILTKGIDLALNSINLKGTLGWTTNFLLSYVKDKVIEYKVQQAVSSNYVTLNYNAPMLGKPYSALFSYRWAGLDNLGNPQGYFNGQISKDYAGIQNTSNLNNLVYHGPASPIVFGSFRNNFFYKGFELSVNLVYKMGYYFRRGSFVGDLSYKQADYALRWQKPGDEYSTNVPSLIYPIDGSRERFYGGSEILVEKGDHIRLQDLKMSYTFNIQKLKSVFSNLKLYFYASNLGAILWRANKLGLDPDYTGFGGYSVASPRSYAIGLSASI
ncbi:SusC/RagA family TonB-linked outer membrane protein [Pedobacter nutrimenti]|uniref:SusC/RagA family TonB-linked outer membrane protein n=1 Tax=Pedobacter nutrimenti TaxID=1241337 RepID=UPI001474FFF1|nr:SusC/RagA family TonB-linked outer membrane protein [Pedobacter nutrimenti]